MIRCKVTLTPETKLKRGTIAKLIGHTWVNFFYLLVEKRHLNRSVDIRYSIVAFCMSVLTVKLQLGLPRKFKHRNTINKNST